MRSFAENGGLMTNARCLTEGVDLPAVDCICFTDPKRSKIDICTSGWEMFKAV